LLFLKKTRGWSVQVKEGFTLAEMGSHAAHLEFKGFFRIYKEQRKGRQR
jgi:hypothetical protein